MLARFPSFVLPLVAGGLLTGCFSDIETVFPAGVEPLVPPPGLDEAVRFPEGTGGAFPEAVVVETIDGEAAFGLARGYVLAPMRDVMAALTEPEVATDRCAYSSFATRFDTEPDYDISFAVDAVVRDLITIEYTVSYRVAVARGSMSSPEVVALRWQKTSGSSAISELDGSILAEEIAPGVTRIELQQRVDAFQNRPENTARYLRRLHRDIVAHTDGAALGECD
jgi:hypothetical protein